MEYLEISFVDEGLENKVMDVNNNTTSTCTVITSTPQKDVALNDFTAFRVEQSAHSENDETQLPQTSCSANKSDKPKPRVHCKICKYSTTSRGNLYRHTRAIHEKKTVSCDICSKRFKDMYDLRQHLISIHQNIQMICEICSKGFNNRHTLQRHKIMNHLDKAKYVCRMCGKKFYERFSYHGHINKHVNSRPYSCPFCNKSFGYKFCLKRHVLTCSGKNIDKYKCTICDNQLKSQRNEVCRCGKAFSWQHSLSRHRKTCKVAKSN